MHSKGLMASAFALAVLFLMAMAAPSWAAKKCTGPTGAVEIKGEVRAEAGCELSGATVKGNVIVEPGGSVITNDEGPTTVITGNVEGSGAAEIGLTGRTLIGGRVRFTGTTAGVALHSGSVNGNVEIEGGVPRAVLLNETVGGSVLVLNASGEPTDGAIVAVASSSVGGNVEFLNNSLVNGIQDVVAVEGTSVTGNVLMLFNTETETPEHLAFEARVSLSANHVGGNAELLDNKIRSVEEGIRLTEVSQNAVTNTLICVGNEPPPLGKENTAKQKLGQCELL